MKKLANKQHLKMEVFDYAHTPSKVGEGDDELKKFSEPGSNFDSPIQ